MEMLNKAIIIIINKDKFLSNNGKFCRQRSLIYSNLILVIYFKKDSFENFLSSERNKVPEKVMEGHGI